MPAILWQNGVPYEDTYGIGTSASNVETITGADIIVLCVKPQTLGKGCSDLRGNIDSDALVISIIAGARMSTLRKALNHDRIVRSMPNTPAQIGERDDRLDAHRDSDRGAT